MNMDGMAEGRLLVSQSYWRQASVAISAVNIAGGFLAPRSVGRGPWDAEKPLGRAFHPFRRYRSCSELRSLGGFLCSEFSAEVIGMRKAMKAPAHRKGLYRLRSHESE